VEQPKVAMLGGGSWATALVKILNTNKIPVNWYIRDAEIIRALQSVGHNPRYLSSVSFELSFNNLHENISSAITSSDLVMIAIPAAFLESSIEKLPKDSWKNKKIVSAVKGMVPEKNMILGDYFNQCQNVSLENFGVISGPCHAEEVAMEKLSYLTLASQNQELSKLLCNLLNCRYIKASPSDDIYGTEYAAVMKNIYAIASGICHGLGYGDNFQAVLISNAIEEMEKFVKAVHPISRDIKDSAYLGDLLVTAYSQYSRNRTFGTMIGKGYGVKTAQLEMNMIAEGYYASVCVHEVNKQFKVEMPIAEAVYNILYNRYSPIMEIRLLSDKLS
jgi:glycerol-3-phosphate dehydrogenase (NAD(P)+)